MTLHVIDPDHIVESVTLTKVDEDRSEALMSQFDDDDPGPQVGWRLSTRCPWHFEF